MFASQLDYTVCSTDPSNYNRINCNLTAPITQYSAMTVTCLTTNCCIVVLSKDDSITINDVKYLMQDDYTDINLDTFAVLLNQIINESKVKVSLDNANRLTFISGTDFIINDMSYNMQMITGFYNAKLPIKAVLTEVLEEIPDPNESGKTIKDIVDRYVIKSDSVGFALSTPVLYLISNIGVQSYRNINNSLNSDHFMIHDNHLSGAKIVMRLNNSFMSSSPIIMNNADFETTLLSNDLSSLEFTLVDAYMHEVKLLSPMYLSIHIRAIEDVDIESFATMIDQNGQK